MRFKRTSFMLVVGIALLSAAFVFSDKSSVVLATEPNTWTDGAMDLKLVNQVTGTEAANTPSGNCTNMTIPVVRMKLQEWFKNNEQHCMMQVGVGMVDDFMSVYQPEGLSWAYPVESKPGNNASILPIPEQQSALYMNRNYPYVGEYIGYYKNLYGSFQFNKSFLHPAYAIKTPDSYFLREDGSILPFMPKINFSNNGSYVVAEARDYGFVRINTETKDMTAFAANTIKNSWGDPLGANVAISPSGKYATVAYNNQSWGTPYFKVVDVDSCSTNNVAFKAGTSTCKSFDYLPQLKKAIPGITQVTSIQFASDNSMNFIAVVGSGVTASYYRYEMSPMGQPTRLEDYLALGDSFASGEGTFSYTIPTDTDLNKCHQSLYSYPFLLNTQVSSTESVACSGATTGNIKGAEKGQRNNQLLNNIPDRDIPDDQKALATSLHIPGIVEQERFIGVDNPQIVTVSIGGNDVGFSNIIKRCIIPFDNISSTSQNCYQTYEDRKELVDLINSTYGDLVDTYKKLTANDPTRRVYVIGYPQVVSPTGSCGVNVRMSQSDRLFAAQLTSYLDSVVERAAAEAGVYYVNTQHAFDGHKLCDDGDKAVNGITAGNDHWYGIGNESYHPNKLGHELLASTILAATDNLTSPMPASQIIPAPNENDLEILQAPHTGRLMYNIINGGKDVVFVGSGGALNLYSDSYTDIIQPDGVIDTVLHSTPVDLGTLSTDSDGVIHGSVQIPADTEPGFHTLHMYTNDMFGQPIDIQQILYIGASAEDYDGDGVLNTADSCPSIPQSGQDQDQDGIDDTCDPEIGPAPVQQPQGNDNEDDGNNTSGDTGTTGQQEGQQGDGQANTSVDGDGKSVDSNDTTGVDFLDDSNGQTFVIKNLKVYTNKSKSNAAAFLGHIKADETAMPANAGLPQVPATPKDKLPQYMPKQHKTGHNFWYIFVTVLFAIAAALTGRYALKRTVDEP